MCVCQFNLIGSIKKRKTGADQGFSLGIGDFNALACYLSLIFKHSDTKWDKKKQKKNIVDQK